MTARHNEREHVSITTETKKNPRDTGSTRIRKEDIKTPIDSDKTADELQAEIEKSGGTTAPEEPTKRKRTVARAALCLAEQVFHRRRRYSRAIASTTSLTNWLESRCSLKAAHPVAVAMSAPTRSRQRVALALRIVSRLPWPLIVPPLC
jgi:hypothetical protein